MKHLYLVRHGETLFNKRRKIQGWCDSPLTPLGIQQAKEVKEKLEKLNIQFDGFYCSTSERASDTLEIIIGENQPYIRLKGLKEINHGIFEGESEDLHPYRDGKRVKDEVYPVYYNGESSTQLKKRVYKTIQNIMEKDIKVVLAVSHGGACWAFASSVTDFKDKIDNCDVLHFTYDHHQSTYLGKI